MKYLLDVINHTHANVTDAMYNIYKYKIVEIAFARQMFCISI